MNHLIVIHFFNHHSSTPYFNGCIQVILILILHSFSFDKKLIHHVGKKNYLSVDSC